MTYMLLLGAKIFRFGFTCVKKRYVLIVFLTLIHLHKSNIKLLIVFVFVL